MKKMLLTTLVGIVTILSYAGQKIDIKFVGKKADYYLKRKTCVIKDNVLSVSGDTADKNNRWRSIVFPISFKAPAGKKYKFSGEIKGEKIKGKFEVAIRLIKADGKSITYKTYTIKKDQDWKKFSKTFTAPANTAKMEYYILARDMANDSVGSVKNLSIEQL